MPAWRLVAEPETPVGEGERRRFHGLAARRGCHEPIAYLLGEREFWGRPFETGPEVLVPRPETEGLVETALAKTAAPDPLIAEVGTGSGCVAVSLALELPRARVVATDPSPGALEIARLGVQCGLTPLFELRDGVLTKVRRISDPLPVDAYLKAQKRFRHLFSDTRGKGRIAALQRIADNNIRKYGLLKDVGADAASAPGEEILSASGKEAP